MASTLRRAPAEVLAWLEAQPWIHDQSNSSLDAVSSIVAAASPDLRGEDGSVLGDLRELLEAVSGSDWYLAGVGEVEKARISEIFRLYRSWQVPVGLLDRPAFMDELSAHLSAAVRGGMLASYASKTGKQIEIVALTEEHRFGAREALDAAVEYLPEVERLAGTRNRSSVAIILESLDGPCGLAYEHLSLIRVDPACNVPSVVVHELVHLATPDTAAIWFEEGYAFLVQHMLTAELDRGWLEEEVGDHRFVLDWFFTTNPPPREQYGPDSIAGWLFLLRVSELIGIDALTGAVLGLFVDPPGQSILNAIYAATPPDKRPEIRELVRASCVETTYGREGWPCEPT